MSRYKTMQEMWKEPRRVVFHCKWAVLDKVVIWVPVCPVFYKLYCKILYVDIEETHAPVTGEFILLCLFFTGYCALTFCTCYRLQHTIGVVGTYIAKFGIWGVIWTNLKGRKTKDNGEVENEWAEYRSSRLNYVREMLHT